MWILRILTGPLTGTKFELQEGANTVGRGQACAVEIPHGGVSKEHAVLKVSGSSLELADNDSSNGVYVNGVRVRHRRLQNGDRIGFSDIMADIHEIKGTPRARNLQVISNGTLPQLSSVDGLALSANTAMHERNSSGSGNSPSSTPGMSSSISPADLKPKTWWSPAVAYIEDVVLPGIYRLGESSDFKWVLISFILIFSFLVTVLATVPLVQITQSSIEQESQLRTLGLAEHLADRFSQGLQSGSIANLNFDSILRQKGVRAAYVIASNDGHIVAPASKSGTFSNDPFVNRARQKDQRFVEDVSSSVIGASVPISQYNAERGRYEPQYDAIILYDMAGLAIDDGRVISLFVKVLTIAVMMGGVLFFFLYRFILYPITQLSTQIDRAMIEKGREVRTTYKFPEIYKLGELVNSLLARVSFGDEVGQAQFAVDRISEVSNLVHFMNTACMAAWGDGRVMAVNAGFGDITGVREDYYRDKPISSMTDQALTLNMEDLMERAKATPSLIAESGISISERDFRLGCQVFMKEDGPDYFLFFLQSVEG